MSKMSMNMRITFDLDRDTIDDLSDDAKIFVRQLIGGSCMCMLDIVDLDTQEILCENKDVTEDIKDMLEEILGEA